MEAKSSFSCSQDANTGPCPESQSLGSIIKIIVLGSFSIYLIILVVSMGKTNNFEIPRTAAIYISSSTFLKTAESCLDVLSAYQTAVFKFSRNAGNFLPV
jgi:hypothetical protein